jgi:PPOX class probable F420-dependent enzyme
VNLTSRLDAGRRAHVEARLHGNLIAWLTTVGESMRPVSVPVWFLVRDDDSIVVYSEPDKLKLRNIEQNPYVALGLDVTDLGRDVIRIAGTAAVDSKLSPANQNPQYVAKYTERIGAIFGAADRFAELYSVGIVITPIRLWA